MRLPLPMPYLPHVRPGTIRWTMMTALVLGVPLASCAAAELVIKDLQASALVRPTAFDFELETPSLRRSGSDAFKAGTALEFGGRYSISRIGDPVGIVIGLDATTESYNYGSHDFMFTYGLRGSLGCGYAINDTWVLTGEVGALYGRSDLSLPSSDVGPAFSADGPYRGYDFRLTCRFAVMRGLSAGLHAGYMTISHDLSTDDGSRLMLDQRGPFIGIGLAWSWSSAPAHVE